MDFFIYFDKLFINPYNYVLTESFRNIHFIQYEF